MVFKTYEEYLYAKRAVLKHMYNAAMEWIFAYEIGITVGTVAKTNDRVALGAFSIFNTRVNEKEADVMKILKQITKIDLYLKRK